MLRGVMSETRKSLRRGDAGEILACHSDLWKLSGAEGKQAFLLQSSEGPGVRAAERVGALHARRRLRLPFALKSPVIQQCFVWYLS